MNAYGDVLNDWPATMRPGYVNRNRIAVGLPPLTDCAADPTSNLTVAAAFDLLDENPFVDDVNDDLKLGLLASDAVSVRNDHGEHPVTLC